MKYLISAFIFTLCISCKNHYQEKNEVAFDNELANELKQRAALDQTAAWIPQGKFKAYSKEEWKAYKDSVFKTNKQFLEAVLHKYGYPGYDLVGQEGELNFWLMIQHCDFDPDFQTRVLEKLKVQVANKNADARNFGLLTDRVHINTGKKQIYGTQVTYIPETGQAVPKPLLDSIKVDERRRSVGLEPLEVYLNRMTISHYQMSKENMLKRGITEPKLYPVKQ